MTDLATVTTPRRLGADRFEADIPDGWQQGRGAFGGLVIGNLVRSITSFDGESEAPGPARRLRSVTAAICGPVLPGPNPIRVERLRTGTGVSTIAARIEQSGEVLAHAVGLLGRDRAPGTDFCDVKPPPMPPWREVDELPAASAFGPPFARHFEFRPLPPFPFTSSKEAVIAGWVRPRDPGTPRDAAYIATLIDAYWPALFSRMSEFRPMATVAYTLELVDDLAGLAPDAPLFHWSIDHVSRGGYVSEERQLWREDGRLVARNHQVFTIIK